MAWAKSISLDVANKLFDVIGFSFEFMSDLSVFVFESQ
jgi:hypothetical protein